MGFQELVTIDKSTGNVKFEGNPIDFVVKQGISGIWTYRKWYSGISECWCKVETTQKFTVNTFGELYRNDTSINVPDFPSNLFIDIPHITLTAHGGDGYFVMATKANPPSNTNINGFTLVRPKEANERKYIVNVTVKGRWK